MCLFDLGAGAGNFAFICPFDKEIIAGAGGLMPPKSTWFAPKLVDGLISHVLD